VDQSENYYHVRYRDPDDFDEIRTPDWAENVANSLSRADFCPRWSFNANFLATFFAAL